MATKTITIRNRTRPGMRPIRAKWGDSFMARLQGFTFRKSLEPDEGLVLVEARDSRVDTYIHMFFVWTDLAVAWVNSNNEVVSTALAKAWRPFYAPAKPARYVVEFHPARHGEIQPGDLIQFEHD